MALGEWFFRRRALAQARSESPFTEAAARALVLARDSLRSGDRLLDPPDGSPRQRELAVAMFRESAYWLLAAGSSRAEADGALAERLAALRDSDGVPSTAWLNAHPAPAVLLESPLIFASKSLEQRDAQAEAMQRWVRELARAVDDGFAGVKRLERERKLRLGALLAFLLGLCVLAGVALRVATRKPDLALGKPWRTSSTLHVCNPEKRLCGGAATHILFHTREEDNPWYEVDLLSPKRIHGIEIVNRSDDGQDRAVPLIVEVSLDAQKYFQVARRADLFDVWDAEFSPVDARYVRVTVLKRAPLHLERVSVR